MEETQTAETTAPARGYRQRDHGTATNTVVIGPRDSLIGKLTVEADVRVAGLLEGELNASGDVTVEGTVNGPINGRNVTVRGQVEGDVVARERLVLAGPGVLTGNVKIGRLSIEEGATLNGNVSMVGKGHGGAGHGHGESEAPAES